MAAMLHDRNNTILFPWDKMFILMQNIFIVPAMQHGRHAKPLFTVIFQPPSFLYSGRVLLGLFRNRNRNRNTGKKRDLCSFGSYHVFGMNGISFRSFCSR